MLNIDKAIYDTNLNICKNISRFDSSERGLLSQNILSQLRNLVEYIAEKIMANGSDTDPNDYKLKEKAISFIKGQGQYRFLNLFHSLLQKSVSHYTVDENGSERLMLKYYEYLIRIKTFLQDNFGMMIFENIDEFPLDTDPHFKEYYEKICEKVVQPNTSTNNSKYDDRCYVQKIKPFFVSGKIFYEITFTMANDKASKFDRVIAFTQHEISDFYAVKFLIRNDSIHIMGKKMPIQIIDSWQVSIRPCELDRFAAILGESIKSYSNYYEYRELMKFLTISKMSLNELVESDDEYYLYIKNQIFYKAKTVSFFKALDNCRTLIQNSSPGSNVVRYLLHKLNNKILKLQQSSEQCQLLSGLFLNYGCIPFDQMPFATSLLVHNPKIRDLMNCISDENRKHEFLARIIKNNSEHSGVLFTPLNDLKSFSNIDYLIQSYNSRLYYKQKKRSLKKYGDYIYVQEHADDSSEIIKNLFSLTFNGIQGYSSSVESWLRDYEIDCEEKRTAILNMFDSSSIALIYGSAGTGKSTLINHISNFFSDRDKIFLANTHPAVENMRRKVKTTNSDFKTIRSFLSKRNFHKQSDILIIDECSTVSNRDMRGIIETADFKLLILVGDVYQIESIHFGNWFSVAKSFVPDSVKIELTQPYRTKNQDLLTVWDRVRNLDIAILEPVVKNKYSQNLDDSLFERFEDDEIILCLNYDGLYGINNINRFLQGNNSNPSFEWGVSTYKINDPVLFNESERFAPLIYNNMKGNIINIIEEDSKIWFAIELDIAINEWDANGYDFELLGISEKNNSIIGFWVDKYKSTDDDEDTYGAVVPFQVSYAVSIHKAQGLEYNSVKIVITNEVEELISHNIFYTAITRTKEKLKIYWTPETEKHILSFLEARNYNRDSILLKNIYNL